MALEERDVIKVTDKTGVNLHEYKGKYSLDVATLGNNNTWYSQWVFKSIWKDGKPIPDEAKRVMGVYLGDKETAVKTLAAALKELGWQAPAEPASVPEESIPF